MLKDGEVSEENIERVKREVQERQMAYRKEYQEGRILQETDYGRITRKLYVESAEGSRRFVYWC
jgi:hypothetical protein